MLSTEWSHQHSSSSLLLKNEPPHLDEAPFCSSVSVPQWVEVDEHPMVSDLHLLSSSFLSTEYTLRMYLLSISDPDARKAFSGREICNKSQVGSDQDTDRLDPAVPIPIRHKVLARCSWTRQNTDLTGSKLFLHAG
jgi:hypothetical protein